MADNVDVAIIGAGTAGLSAFKQANKVTENLLLIDHGPLGTTCARVGCMPSKVMLQAADYFYERNYFSDRGINGVDQLTLDIPKAMSYVRRLRDYYTAGVLKYIHSLGDRFVQSDASFLDAQTLQIGERKISAKKIIIATGSHPVIPGTWQTFEDRVLTSDSIFEQQDLPNKMTVIGAGVIGLELGQAMSRMGIDTHVFTRGEFIGSLSDPVVNDYAVKTFKEEFSLSLHSKATVALSDSELKITGGGNAFSSPKILAALGRQPNLSKLNLDIIGLKINKEGLPDYDRTTMKVDNFPIYIAGDVNKQRPLLHEAADEGHIAGYNSVHETQYCFHRRVPLTIIFTQPNIAIVGRSYDSLKGQDIVIGEVLFDDQGRARLMSKNKGILRIYAAKETGKLLGSEMVAPFGEHIAHMLAWAIQQEMTAFEVLRMPYYHPTVQEGMRTALRDLTTKLTGSMSVESELSMCDSEAHPDLS